MVDNIMAQIIIELPITHLAAFLRVHPNRETVSDPEWVDPGDGSIAPKIPKYTDAQWIKEWGARAYRTQVTRGYRLLHEDSIVATATDDIV
jgi:hypothetical protein